MPPIVARRAARLFASTCSGLALVLVAVACLAGTSSAIAAELSKEEKTACTEDAKRLCPGVRPGGGRILQCLAEHKENLSSVCGGAIAEAASAAN